MKTLLHILTTSFGSLSALSFAAAPMVAHGYSPMVQHAVYGDCMGVALLSGLLAVLCSAVQMAGSHDSI